MEVDIIELYSSFIKPVLPFTYVAVLILVAFPLAAVIGFKIGAFERRRLGYETLPTDQLPGATSLGAMLALLGLLLGFAFNSAINWREDRQSQLVNEANAISTAFLTASLLDEPDRAALQEKLMILIAAIAALTIVGNRSALHGRSLTWRTIALALLLAAVIIVVFDLDRSLEGTMRTKPDTMIKTIFDMEKTLKNP